MKRLSRRLRNYLKSRNSQIIVSVVGNQRRLVQAAVAAIQASAVSSRRPALRAATITSAHFTIKSREDGTITNRPTNTRNQSVRFECQFDSIAHCSNSASVIKEIIHCRSRRCGRYACARLSLLKRNETTSVSRTIGFMPLGQSSCGPAIREAPPENRRWTPHPAKSRQEAAAGRAERRHSAQRSTHRSSDAPRGCTFQLKTRIIEFTPNQLACTLSRRAASKILICGKTGYVEDSRSLSC